MISFREPAYFVALLIMLGWLLHIGKPVLLPIMIALIALYILSNLTTRLGELPGFGLLPALLRRVLVLLSFTALVVLVSFYVVETFAQVAVVLPSYESNLDRVVTRIAMMIRIEDEPTWANIRALTFDQFEVGAIIGPVLASLRGFSSTVFLVILYAFFFMAERAGMPDKLRLALGDSRKEAKTVDLFDRINTRVGDYLAVKTVVNIILGVLSYGVMLPLGIDFALFWAILIALLNYIPYIGSMIGVLFPVLLSLAQTGSIGMAGTVMVALTAAQMFVAGFLEPRMMSRAFNLSPFVVLLALAFWSSLWGLAGAVLAVPLTASLIIVMAEIETTRPVAILLSASGKV
ncbi:AI-2E family transporter [Salipiger sp. 1_MG-2023]|uniref:AI-2E family transporter n=1 Tax=Salipiger sp. 1_MG-2023 TaxID=3062665 RepID=UPI0026E410A5|nr:AI-2E family transporter [Salipiger sp. 1_MG-2023]MDO6586650.1 AI-2E family transporter [Salipiger sp. 1_MG-2023]